MNHSSDDANRSIIHDTGVMSTLSPLFMSISFITGVRIHTIRLKKCVSFVTDICFPIKVRIVEKDVRVKFNSSRRAEISKYMTLQLK